MDASNLSPEMVNVSPSVKGEALAVKCYSPKVPLEERPGVQSVKIGGQLNLVSLVDRLTLAYDEIDSLKNLYPLSSKIFLYISEKYAVKITASYNLAGDVVNYRLEI
nr:MAG: hypothetical protein [Microvirus sp.]